MIKCPLCNQFVQLNKTYENILHLEDDNIIDNFYCPTYVNVAYNIRLSHYTRFVNDHIVYDLITAPFYIIWDKTNQSASVDIFGKPPMDWKCVKQIYSAYNIDDAAILKLYNKFAELKVFV